MPSRRSSRRATAPVTLGAGSAPKQPHDRSGAISGPKTDCTSPALVALSEREFQRIVRAGLERRGFVVSAVPNMKLTTAGLPDLICWHERLPGLLLALELKRERDSRTTPAQKAWLAHLETVPGIEARILRPSGWERLRDTLDLMLTYGRPAAAARDAGEVREGCRVDD